MSGKAEDTSSQDFFEQLGLHQVINAAGKLTVLGASILSAQTAAAMMEAGQHFVDLAELMRVADRLIALATGAEAGFITSCAAAGIAITTAACLTRGDISRTESLPLLVGLPDSLIIQRGHIIHFGGSILQMMALTGARIVEIGATNRTQLHQLRSAITEHTAGIMFVVSHHTYPGGFVSLEETIRIAHERNIPVIVDAAAETDLRKYIAARADLVIYSGHKGLNAPTSGIIAGRRALIDACAQQSSGIGRAMKIGKEGIIGCLAALQQHVERDKPDRPDSEALADAPASKLKDLLGDVLGIGAELVADPTRPEIVRLRLSIDPLKIGFGARDLVAKLESHTPSIRTRNHAVDHGIIEIDFRTLRAGEEQIIAQAVRWYVAGEHPS